MQFEPKGNKARGRAMSLVQQNDERRSLRQMVRFENQTAVRIAIDCVNRRERDFGGTNPRSERQEKEKRRLFHFAFHPQLHGLTRLRSATTAEREHGSEQHVLATGEGKRKPVSGCCIARLGPIFTRLERYSDAARHCSDDRANVKKRKFDGAPRMWFAPRYQHEEGK